MALKLIWDVCLLWLKRFEHKVGWTSFSVSNDWLTDRLLTDPALALRKSSTIKTKLKQSRVSYLTWNRYRILGR